MNRYIVGSALSMLMITSSALAEGDDSRVYLGVGGTTGSGEYSATASISGFSATASVDYDSSSIPIKIGFIMEDNDRLELSYESIKAKASDLTTETVSGGNLDWKFMGGQKTSVGELTPYGVVGIGLYEWENTAQYFTDNENLKGVSWNVGAGGLYGLADDLELEALLQYKQINWQDVKVSGVTVESDSSHVELYAGLNYKF